ncbi:MAG: peptidase M23, partial [Ruminococcaceae bacterium]|nr:peptidase M23 [Oscillospiraceae bacterium]
MRNKRVVAGICLFLALLMVVTVVLSVLGSTAKAVSKADIDVLQKQKEAVAAQRAEMQQNINQLLSEKSGVLEQKQVLDDKNELARQEIELINEQIGLFTSLIKQKEEELEKAKAAEKAQYDMFKSRVRAMEENGSYTYLALLFKAKSLSDLLTNIDMVSEIMTSDKRL